MCGRYVLRASWREMRDLYEIAGPEIGPPALAPHFNIAPSQTAPVVRLGENGKRELALLKWGLVPSSADDPKTGFKMINARAETVAAAPSFRTAFKRRRCLVPADGFYEWRAAGERKQPWWIGMKDGAPFAFAGLWERWTKAAAPIESYTIITCAPNPLLREIHNRMPVILSRDSYEMWLAAADTTIPEALLQPYPADRMKAYAVGAKVNSPRNDDPSVLKPA